MEKTIQEKKQEEPSFTLDDIKKHFANAKSYIPVNTNTVIEFTTKNFVQDSSGKVWEADAADVYLFSLGVAHFIYDGKNRIAKIVESNFTEDSQTIIHTPLKNQWLIVKNFMGSKWVIRTDDGSKFYGFNSHDKFVAGFSSDINRMIIERGAVKASSHKVKDIIEKEAKARYINDSDKISIMRNEIWVKKGNLEVVYDGEQNKVKLYSDISETPGDGYVSTRRTYVTVFEDGKWTPIAT